MTCAELRDHMECYALGLAEEPERSEIRAHLDRECEVCMAAIQQAREMVAMLGGMAALRAPSPKLRRRILASVGFEQRSLGWLLAMGGVAALSLCAAVYFSGRERQFSYEATILREQARTQTIELTRLNEAFAILYGADTTVVSFGEKQPKPRGKVFYNPSLGFLLVASSLPPAPAGKAYEAWLIPKGGKAPVPAGMFQARDDGTAMHLDRRALDMSATQAVAVTLEVAAGVGAPTSTPLIVAGLPPALQ